MKLFMIATTFSVISGYLLLRVVVAAGEASRVAQEARLDAILTAAGLN